MILDILAAATPRLGGGGELAVSIPRIVLALIACLVIALAAILLLRQRGGRSLAIRLPHLAPGERRIAMVETRRLSQHADLCLVEHDARRWLIVVQASEIHILSDTGAP